MAPQCCWSSHKSVLPFSKKLMSGSVKLENVHLASWWWDFAFVSTACHQLHNNCICNWHRLPKRLVLIANNPMLCHCHRSSSSGSTKNLMFVLVDVDLLMRLSLATCLTETHQPPSLTVFSWVDVSITRTTYCFESRSKIVHSCDFCCSQSLPDVFQLLLSDLPFRLSNIYCHSNSCCLFSFRISFCFSTVCKTELGRMTCFCTIVTDSIETSTFALPFAFLRNVQLTHHLNFLMCWHHQFSSLVPVLLRARSH